MRVAGLIKISATTNILRYSAGREKALRHAGYIIARYVTLQLHHMAVVIATSSATFCLRARFLVPGVLQSVSIISALRIAH